MSSTFRSVRLTEFHQATLNRNTYERGEIFYDVDNHTIRIMNGRTPGGTSLLKSDLSNLQQTALNRSINLGTGTLTGTLTGNASSATKLATARTINGVAFDGTTNIALPAASSLTLPGTTLNSTIVSSSLTSVGTLTNLTVTNPINGTITGIAPSATKLNTSRNINGVAFDGTSDITITLDINTTTGTILPSTVVASSLTSVGVLTSLEVVGDIIADANVIISNKPSLVTHATNKSYVDKRSIAMSVALG